MHPKAYEILVNFEQSKRERIQVQIAELSRAWEESMLTERNIPLPDVYVGESGRLHPTAEDV